MNDAQLINKLCSVAETDAEALAELVQQIQEECRGASTTLIEEWLKDNGNTSTKAAFVAGQIHELALHEMLKRVEAVSTDLRVDLMTTVLDTLVQLRNLLTEQLVPLLDDRTPVDSPSFARACDAAYILICKVEGRAKDKPAERLFWDSSNDDRNREIANWQDERRKAAAAENEI